MGDIDQLKEVFAETWDWTTGGEEWSEWWGGTPSLWYGGLLPRIHTFVPTGTILEIAPGFGRWTQYLKDLCDSLILVDLAPKCIEHCQKRFADAKNITYYVNDGTSLSMIDDSSVDFVYTWDSLVHADAEIINSYVKEFRRILKPDGVAWMHHSNVKAVAASHKIAMRSPKKLLKMLINRGVLLDVFAWRSPTVSAADVAAMCASNGLAVPSQEIFNWEHGRFLTEAITVMTPQESKFARPAKVVTHHDFRADAARFAALYADTGFPAASRTNKS